MMEVLSGPNTIARIDGDRLAIPAIEGSAFWDDDLGLCILGNVATVSDTFGYGPNYFIVQMDGTSGARGKSTYGRILLDMSNDAFGYEYNLYRTYFDTILSTTVGQVSGFDKHLGIFEGKQIAKSAGIFAYEIPQVRMSNRMLFISAASIYKRATDGSDPALVLEHTLTPAGSLTLYTYPSTPYVSRTNTPGEICMIYPSGGILYYNVDTQVQTTGYIKQIGAHHAAWYSRRLDVFIAFDFVGSPIATDGQLTIYANSPLPASISYPVAVTTLNLGKVSNVRTQVLGAQGEPCADELINWSITAGPGSLTSSQSFTDAEGYAATGYVAPLVASLYPTFQATMEF